MEIHIKATQTRSVSARELSRRMAALLDEIEEKGSGLVVQRYGRPAALLVPLESNVGRAPRRVAIEARDEAAPEEFEIPELKDADRRLLLQMADRIPDRYYPDDWAGPIETFCAAFTRLEMAGLAVLDGGHRLTTQGEQVAVSLRG